jgi:hypothetical protein
VLPKKRLGHVRAESDALFTNIQNNYHTRIMLNLGEISGHWSWGDTQADTDAHNAPWYEANFGPMLNYTETWANGVNGNCLTAYWYEAAWPTFASWLRNSTTLQIDWALSGWEKHIGSTCSHDVVPASRGSWITGGYNVTQTPIATRFAEINAVDIEIWWTGQVPT